MILTVISTFVYFIIFGIKLYRKGTNNLFLAFLITITLQTSIVYVSNEILSLFHAITSVTIYCIWILMTIIGIVLLWRLKINKNELKPVIMQKVSKHITISTLVILIFLSAFVFAICTVPNNWDSMTYHLTRVVHWIQNGSIEHYSCHDISQISDPPLAEFVLVHIYLLSNSTDTFLNLLQTFSYGCCILLVYNICGKIGCNELMSRLATLLFATSPIIYNEALTTQVDIFSALWALMFAYIALDFINYREKLSFNYINNIKLVMLGLTAGFSYLAKPSATIAVIFFSLWLLIHCIKRKDSFANICKALFIVVSIGVVVILPELMRNIITFGAIADEEASTGFLIPEWNLPYLLLNFCSNIAFNLNNQFVDIEDKIIYFLDKLTSLLREEDTISEFNGFALVSPTSMSQDYAINPLIIYLTLILILVCFFQCAKKILLRKNNKEMAKKDGKSTFIFVSLISLVCFFSIVKWYTYITRYEITYLALMAISTMWMLQILMNRNEKLCYEVVGILVFISCINYGMLLQSNAKSVYTSKRFECREQAYFARRNLYEDYNNAAEYIKDNDFTEIGIIVGNDSYEYPFWKLVEKDVERIEHVCVENDTNRYDDKNFVPQCILSSDVDVFPEITYHGAVYKNVFVESSVSMYVVE